MKALNRTGIALFATFVIVALIAAYSMLFSVNAQLTKELKDDLRDPGSLVFKTGWKELYTYQSKVARCARISARNSYGGYGEAQLALGVIDNGGRITVAISGDDDICDRYERTQKQRASLAEYERNLSK